MHSPPSSFKPTTGAISSAQRIGIYGTGGVGKTSLVQSLKQIGKRPLILDVDNGSKHLDVARLSASEGLSDWASLREVLANAELWKGYDVVCIDSTTGAEEWAVAHTLATVKKEKGESAKSVEDYGFGKGYIHVYDTFLPLLSDLDAHVRSGRDVVLVMHDCVTNAPNPTGDDFIRYEPRLQSPTSGKASIRHRVKEWLDHLLFVGYDVVSSDGKGKGCGSRAIYPQEMPSHVAKSRSLASPIVYAKYDSALWQQLFGKE